MEADSTVEDPVLLTSHLSEGSMLGAKPKQSSRLSELFTILFFLFGEVSCVLVDAFGHSNSGRSEPFWKAVELLWSFCFTHGQTMSGTATQWRCKEKAHTFRKPLTGK